MAATASSAVALPSPSLEQRRAALGRMTPAQRLAAYRRGELTFQQCCSWAARWPAEVPTVNGEYEWIALAMADLDAA